MGGKLSTHKNSVVPRRLADDSTIKLKVLMLGASGSGKSTTFKQFRIEHNQSFSTAERRNAQGVIYENIYDSCRRLVKTAVKFSEDDPRFKVNSEISQYFVKKAHSFVRDNAGNWSISDEGEDVEMWLRAWNEPGVQLVFNEQRKEVIVSDSLPYYMSERLEAIMGTDYMPNDQDMLQSRVITSGIHEIKIPIENTMLHVIDVGGQKSERRKWMFMFEDVSAVIYIASLAGYARCDDEDQTTNELKGALAIFDEIIRKDWFKTSTIILFLNKRDLFLEELKKTPFTDCFADFEGDPTKYEECVKYIQERFEKSNSRKHQRKLQVHITKATDQHAMTDILKSVREMVFNSIANMMEELS